MVNLHTYTHMHRALGAALWVLSVHNMAAIILLAAAAEAWGQTEGGGEETGIKKRRCSQQEEVKQQSSREGGKQADISLAAGAKAVQPYHCGN